ncbi:MAG: tetratricopeptide repeat protein [Bryobacteraceae bacterium]|nr:tetratricopeptide repeat protein [Bryobacteraceae bacterium]
MRRIVVLLCAPAVFAADDPIARGYDHFYNLEFDQAVEQFAAAIANTPGNPQAHNHLAHAILYREMLRSGALESELVTGTNPFLKRERLKPSIEDQKRFEAAIARALELSEARVKTTPRDADAWYARGVSLGLRGNYNFLVRKAWMDALRDITDARKSHARVTELEPPRVDARLIQGVHDYVVGSLPFFYKMLGFVVGFRGDREGGIRTLREVAAKGRDNRTDAEVLLAAVYRRERRAAEAIPLLKDLIRRYPRNYLFRLEIVQMYSDSGDKESALTELQAMERLKQVPAGRVSVSRGTLLFWYRDYDGAIEELKKAAAKASDMDLNSGSMAWLRLGQSYDMKQNRDLAVAAYQRTISLAPDSDAARQARDFLRKPYRRGKES